MIMNLLEIWPELPEEAKNSLKVRFEKTDRTAPFININLAIAFLSAAGTCTAVNCWSCETAQKLRERYNARLENPRRSPEVAD